MRTSAVLGAHSAFDACRTVVDLLQFRALHQPEQTAYRFLKNGEEETSSVTYAELDLKAQAYGAYLRSLGLTGERALLLFPSGPEFISAFFGCLYAGVVAIPAYPPRNRRSLPRIQAILEDAKASAVLTAGANIAKIQSLFESVAGTGALQYVATDEIPHEMADDWEERRIDSDTLAFLQYTSGSTGSPRGVMVSHGNILCNLEMIHAAFQLTEDDIGLGWLPLFHDMGLIGHVLEPIYASIPSILMSPAAFLQKPIRWLRAISKYRATTSGGPNFAYELCLRKIAAEERVTLDLSSWRVAFNGAEPIRASTLDEFSSTFGTCGFRREAFLPCYGLAETTLMVSGGPADSPPTVSSLDGRNLGQHHVECTLGTALNARKLVGCGSRIPGQLQGQRIVIANPETLVECDREEVGEIWVAGPHVAQGYWNQTDETQATFHAYLADSCEGPFLRTGDLGFLRKGELVVTGRLKDLIIINGRNIYPQDIEWEAERSHPSLPPSCGAAFSVHIDDQEQLVIVQELAPRQKPDLEQVLSSIRQAVADKHEIPVYEMVLIKPGTLPKTSSGKIQRRATRAQYLAGELRVVASWCVSSAVAPQQASNDLISGQESETKPAPDAQHAPSKARIKDWLVAQLSAELRMPPSEIDIHQPFTYYGLASVEGVALAEKLEAWLGRPVPLSLVWDCPTIDAVSKHLSGGSDRT